MNTPDTALECTWILRQPDGYVLYFGVPDGATHLLPVGTMYDTIATANWSKVRWLVVESIEQRGKHKGEYGRFYRVLMQRLLDADEAGVWQEMIEQWEYDNGIAYSEET